MKQATAGGGGRGMRLANEPEEIVKLLQVHAFPLVASYSSHRTILTHVCFLYPCSWTEENTLFDRNYLLGLEI